MDYSTTTSSKCDFDSNGFAVISPPTSSRSRRQLRRWKIRKSGSYRKLDAKEEEDQDEKTTSLTIATATSTTTSIRGSSSANGSVGVGEKWVSFELSSSQDETGVRWEQQQIVVARAQQQRCDDDDSKEDSLPVYQKRKLMTETRLAMLLSMAS